VEKAAAMEAVRDLVDLMGVVKVEARKVAREVTVAMVVREEAWEVEMEVEAKEEA